MGRQGHEFNNQVGRFAALIFEDTSLGTKTFLIFLTGQFEVVDFFFLTVSFSLGCVLFLEFRGGGEGKLRFGVESFGINEKVKVAGER